MPILINQNPILDCFNFDRIWDSIIIMERLDWDNAADVGWHCGKYWLVTVYCRVVGSRVSKFNIFP
jgi:hypothetical protein